MAGLVVLNDSPIWLTVEKPEQGEQFAKHGNRAAQRAAPSRPIARDELVDFSKSRDSAPQTISCCENDAADVAHHDGYRTERAGFERRPQRIVLVITRRQLSQNVDLGVGEKGRAKPSGWGFPVRYPISSYGSNHAVRIGQERAHAHIAADKRLPG